MIRHGRVPERNKRRLKERGAAVRDAIFAKRQNIRLVTIASAHGNGHITEWPANRAPEFFHVAPGMKKAGDARSSTARTASGACGVGAPFAGSPSRRAVASLRDMARRHG